MFRFKINNNSTHTLHIRILDKISQNYALHFLESIVKHSITEREQYCWTLKVNSRPELSVTCGPERMGSPLIYTESTQQYIQI